MKVSYLSFFFLTVIFCYGQEKKKIDHTVYDQWKEFSGITQSKTGDWVTYIVNPSVGDGSLTIENVVSGKKKIVDRGRAAKVAFGEEFVVFKIAPQYDSIRRLKLKKVAKSKLPQDTLAVYYTGSDSIKLLSSVKSFKIAEEGNWLGYILNKDSLINCVTSRKRKLFRKKKSKCKKLNTTGKRLVLFNPIINKSKEFYGVVDFSFDKKGERLVFVQSNKGEKDTLSLNIFDLKNRSLSQIDDRKFMLKHLSFNEEGTDLVYLGSTDTNKLKNVNLYIWRKGELRSNILVDSLTTNMPLGYTVSEFRSPVFSKDGEKVFFGTNKIVRQPLKDTLLSSEKAVVDVWSWNDPNIQPVQLLSKGQEEKRSYLAVYHLNKQEMVQLGDTLMRNVSVRQHGDNGIAIGSINKGYEIEWTWNKRGWRDIYTVDINSGKRSLIRKKHGGFFSLSPQNNKSIWYNREDSVWVGMDMISREENKLTEKIDADFSRDNNGQPYVKAKGEVFGWATISGKEYFIVRDAFDIWALNPLNPGGEICLTNGIGKKERIKFSLKRLEKDSTYLQFNASILVGVDDTTKNNSYWSIEDIDGQFSIRKLLESNHQLKYINKAKSSDRVLLRRMNFQTIGELESTDLEFKNIKILSDINPQQKEYNWGTVEHKSWIAYDGKKIRGLLYKPEDFDSTKSYPLLVYIYEKYSHGIHSFKMPKASRSSIQRTEYVSNGYILFIPDIHYKSGYPAKSAYNCVVSGTEALMRRYSWIDSTRIGLQGQSWGGYQTAQLITMTDIYKAAMAGAPVSNMFSAYGGIRWGSGSSRIYQYEKTQSRIGFTIWERPDLYTENSPIFGIPNITTPLLILSNDKDGAVPWYQGIELYMGLRRLSKPSWLLNYNGDAHNLNKLANMKDLSLRMRQFFDHYLLGAPIPIWMKDGVPAIDKGKNYGLELIDD